MNNHKGFTSLQLAEQKYNLILLNIALPIQPSPKSEIETQLQQ